ncbi:MAG TPA: UDP-N-acetylmuramoyl-L-alanine--D-glutamate ligase [Steroidobacteraceae bacterium]|nr:UDP-N-acetylmuramoyl-L-alanine--D-glutamate ligase [Steroidobacteraceae bacterium]
MSTVVVGLGKTGASCIRHLLRRGLAVRATDSRAAPPGLALLGELAGRIDLRLGGLDLALLDGASQLLMSPGLSLDEPIARAARSRGIEVIGDVELFAREARAPVVGITGTNGKSTVTSLIAHMARTAGRRALAGGNLGEPALDLLEQPAPQLYVLELSSFQLETTCSLAPSAATVLNVSADHLDRYATIDDYARAKRRIFERAAAMVLNADDPRVMAMRREGVPATTFSVRRADADYSLAAAAGAAGALVCRGEPLLEAARLKIGGRHNAANALAALALGEAIGLDRAPMLAALETFAGLPHRSQWVAEVGGVRYVDDSKGTNVGATVAAVEGSDGGLVMILGGEGKGQDFTPLAGALRGRARAAVLIGKDAAAIAAALGCVCAVERAGSMQQAVAAAARLARAGETVLLSPACASLDMFRDYAERGAAFAAAVHGLARRRA